jgi:hypothetical protein
VKLKSLRFHESGGHELLQKTRTAFAERVSMLKRGRFKCVDSQLSISGLQLHPPPIERQEEWRVGPELRSIKIENVGPGGTPTPVSCR